MTPLQLCLLQQQLQQRRLHPLAAATVVRLLPSLRLHPPLPQVQPQSSLLQRPQSRLLPLHRLQLHQLALLPLLGQLVQLES